MSKQVALSVVKAPEASPEAPARAALAAAIQARDAVGARLGKAQFALDRQHAAIVALERECDGLKAQAPESETARLQRITGLLNSGEAIPTRHGKPDARTAIAKIEDEIAGAGEVYDDLRKLVRLIADEKEDADRAVKQAARLVLVPALRSLYDRLAALRDELGEGRQLLKAISSLGASRELSNEIEKLTGMFIFSDSDAVRSTPPAAVTWAATLAALETNAAAPLPTL